MIDHDRARALRAVIRRPAVIATIGTLSLALVFGGLLWAGARPTTTAVIDPGASRVPSGAWASLAPSPTVGSAESSAIPLLSASGSKGGVVPLETGFRLESVDGTPASQLAAALSVEPAFAFAIQPEDGDRAVVLTPTEPLQPGFVYRFDLHGSTGELLETWAFQASQPVRVVATLPEGTSTDVPLDTGIEITFDQDGIVDAASHVTISPATDGRFEQHERTTVFVPDRPLKAATIYTVDVSRGVAVESTGEASVVDTRFQFETASTAAVDDGPAFTIQGELMESAVSDQPVIGLWYQAPDEAVIPTTARIEVFLLGGLDAGIAAFREIRARPAWSRWSTEGIVDTAGLDRVVDIKGRLQPSSGAYVVTLPEALDAGWYLVQLPDKHRPEQAILQVTDIAGYLSVSETQTVAWANDLASGRAIAGAAVVADGVAADGVAIGSTDTNGLAMGTTPAGLKPERSQVCGTPCDPVVTIVAPDGRAIFLPTTSMQDKLEAFDDGYFWAEADRTYWALVHTDRARYRPTDTVNLWGVIRRREDGVVPSAVTLELTPEAYDDAIRPPTVTQAATPSASGVFSASMALSGIAEGYYSVALVVDGRTVRTTYLQVGPIVKPAYRLQILTGRRVYIAGDRIKVTVDASFYEGTPVPGVPLRIDGYVERTVKTDAAGRAIHRTTATIDADQEEPQVTTISVSPARPEEGEISGASRDFLIFPSSRTITADATIEGGRVKVAGDAHLVDVDRLEAAIAGGSDIWALDPRGAALRGVTVSVRFTELIPVKTQTGTDYDYIEKQVIPVYETRIVERVRATVRVKTAPDGTYEASIAATRTNHDYDISVWVGDPDGHRARASAWAARHPWSADQAGALLSPTDPADDPGVYGIGDRVDLTMWDPELPQTSTDDSRYLFIEAQSGIRSATVQAAPRYRTTFEAWAAPNLEIGAVRFTGDGYVAAGFDARFRTSDRHLTVDLTSEAARYAPGDIATVIVRTRDASGAGTPATVILRAVDEKLFAIGAAAEDDPLEELYASLPSGVVGGYASHQGPIGEFGGGDTTGGGGDDRDDFRDVVLFRTIETDANGRGSVSFAVSDDLTSWHVSASAITTGLEAGYGSVLVPVGLPFFVDASIASEYLLADRPSIPVRVFGSAIKPGDAATIQVTAPGLGFDSGPLDAVAFETTLVRLPALKSGSQRITFTATIGTGAGARTDRLTRTFEVVKTHLMTTKAAYVVLPGSSGIEGGPGLTRVVISDAGSGRYLPLLTELAAGGGARLDRGLAADMAADLLRDGFGIPSDRVQADRVSASVYQGDDGGLALMPYSSSDLELSSLVALIAPDRVDRARLDTYLRVVRQAKGETRERQTFALAGEAGLGHAVLPAIRAAAADPNLTVRERLMIGLGAARLGDAQTAREIATAVQDEFGERAGTMARLRVGTTAADITLATALMAVLAASVGNDLAPEYEAYVDANPANDQIHVLEAAAFVAEMLARLPVEPVSFTYTVDGDSTTVDLEAGRSLQLSLAAGRLATLRVTPVSGSVGVATDWREPIAKADLRPDPDVTIKRSVSPAGVVDPADLIKVSLTVTFGPQAATGCHQVTELVPSGLTPVGPSAAWISDQEDDGETVTGPGVVLPYDTSGPRVSFCAEPSRKTRTVILRYYARVVTPGTYAWEPAVALSRSHAGRAAQTRAGTITIR